MAHDILVYGSFLEPVTKLNFILVRLPDGRYPWSRKIAPAIERLLREWKDENWGSRASGGYKWNLEGAEERLWNSGRYARYQWDGTALVKDGA